MEVGWKVSRGNTYSRVPSTAAQGNILEAINTALNVMQLHYVDRDLYRCGNSVVVVSAGSGVFEVDKNLAAITKQRMMDNGIGKFPLCMYVTKNYVLLIIQTNVIFSPKVLTCLV